MRLANKTAFITGGNSGIGLATARLFRAEGARVAIVGRNKATLDAAAKLLRDDVLAIQADVTDVAAMEANGFRLPTKRRAYVRGPQLKPIRDLLPIALDLSNFRM